MAVTLIDREPAYVYKPMLHDAIAAGTSDFFSAGDVAHKAVGIVAKV